MQEMLISMYTGTKRTTNRVATRKKAVTGSNWNPSQKGTMRPTTSWSHTATCGERNRGCTLASALGSRRTRPIENHVRVAALDPAFEFARVEFTIAMNTNTQADPHAARPRFSHPVPALKLS